jgi:flavin reductase (DIM6/NTAB) family NADH-FMN oxidoreductase RutF
VTGAARGAVRGARKGLTRAALPGPMAGVSTPEKTILSNEWASLWALPATTVMVSCVGASARPNIITLGASGVACARPPLISLAFGVSRYSLELVKETGDFAVNIPSADQAAVTDWCGRVSGRRIDKFAEGGLTASPSTRIASPFIAECPVAYECTLWRIVSCGSHDLVLGEVQCVHVDSAALNATGSALDPSKCNLLYSVQTEYWDMGRKRGKWGEAQHELGKR